jgi:hypothetical protein
MAAGVLARPAMTRNDASEVRRRYEVHDLREQRLADIHANFSEPGTRKTSRKSVVPFKRNQIEFDLKRYYAMIFDALRSS